MSSTVPAGGGRGLASKLMPWVFAAAAVAAVSMFHDRIFHGPVAAQDRQAADKAPEHRPKYDPATHVTVTPAKLKTIGVSVEPARTIDLASEVDVAGQVVPNSDRLIDIRPRISGIVRTVNFALGQTVRKGDVLAVLDSADVGTARLNLRTHQRALSTARIEADWKREVARNVEELVPLLRKNTPGEKLEKEFAAKALGSFKGMLLSSYADLEIANHEEEKQTDLFKKNIVGEHPVFVAVHAREGAQAKMDGLLEQARFDALQQTRVADQAVRNAEAEVIDAAQRLRILGVSEDIATLLARPKSESDPLAAGSVSGSAVPAGIDEDVTSYPIIAPIDGTILSKSVVPSQRAEPTDVLGSLGDLTSVRVSANISESMLHLLPGLNDAQVHFQATAYPGRTFRAKVLSVGSRVDESTRTVPLIAELPNADGLLKLGMFVRILLGGKTTEKALTVPNGAVVDIEGKTGVFLPVEEGEGDSVYAFHPVSVGRESVGRRVILAGLKPDAKVVVNGAFMLKSELILQNETEEE